MQVTQAIQTRAGRPVQIDYRVVPTTTAQSDFITPPSGTTTDFSVGVGPMNASSFAALGTVIQIPFGFQTISFYYNVPNAPAALNFTACSIAKLLSGSLTSW